jgi:SAM-dependent methyltransferase
MALFPYDELKYYSFGLRAGVSNLFDNGLKLGAKKTFGKIAQPINSYTRFPEYYFFDKAIRESLRSAPTDRPTRILDVGSPKMMGLYLAFNTRAEFDLTDISELNVDEYRLMWRGLEPKARGKARFSIQDARSLPFEDGKFDIVYSMSVIEHIEGAAGDTQAVGEFIRVLRPGGLLILSVPFGNRYAEQQRVGFSYTVGETGHSQAHFFQRIYDQPALENRVLRHAGKLEQVSLTTVGRKNQWMSRSFSSLGENARGVLGFVNPMLSAAGNRTFPGMNSSFPVEYGEVLSAHDVYGDLIMKGRKL